MDGLLVWYALCVVGFMWSVYEPSQKKAPNRVKEWLAQLVASSDPLPDYLYDTQETRPMEYLHDKR